MDHSESVFDARNRVSMILSAIQVKDSTLYLFFHNEIVEKQSRNKILDGNLGWNSDSF